MIDLFEPDYENTPASLQRPVFDYLPEDRNPNPLVSIVTPFYNTRELLDETARCVFRQSLQRWEWLIVNDCSTDLQALATLAKYRDHDPRIVVLDRSVNGGPGAARNAGFRRARAKYVFSLDDDDLIEPTALEKMLWHLETNPQYSFVSSWSIAFGAQQYVWRHGFHSGDAMLTSNLVTGRVMVRKAVHERMGGVDETMRSGFEDWEFWLRCAHQGLWGSTLPEVLEWYRRRSDHGERWPNWDQGKRQASLVSKFRRKFSSLYKEGIPLPPPRHQTQFETIRKDLPFENPLRKQKARILMILPWLTIGGSDKFNLDLVRQLSGRHWEVTIATTLPGHLEWGHLFGRSTPDIFVLHNFLPPVEHAVFLRYLIESRRPDVVLVSHSELGYLVLPYLRANCPKPIYVDYCHLEEQDWRNGGYPRYAVGMQPMLDLNIVASEHLRDWMTDCGANSQRIEVCYTGIDASLWGAGQTMRSSIRRKLGVASDTPLILYAGRLCAQKQPQVFAGVVLELAQRGCDFSALVAGEGEMRNVIEDAVRTHRLEDKVRLMGAVSNDRIRELMLASDVFFLPSQWEGIAISIYEAMAAGLAVVGADVGGQRELVAPDCGLLLPRTNEGQEIQQYADCLSQLLADSERRRQMGARARQRVANHFSLKAMVNHMEELFRCTDISRRSSPRTNVDPVWAQECATQAVELMRMYRVANDLWATRQQAAYGPDKFAPVDDLYSELHVRAQLDLIEHSRAWRMVQRLKRNPLYKVWARLRYGRDVHHDGENLSHEARLQFIRQSRSYRTILFLKRLPLYRWYARRKYGHTGEVFGRR